MEITLFILIAMLVTTIVVNLSLIYTLRMVIVRTEILKEIRIEKGRASAHTVILSDQQKVLSERFNELVDTLKKDRKDTLAVKEIDRLTNAKFLDNSERFHKETLEKIDKTNEAIKELTHLLTPIPTSEREKK